MTKIVAWTIHGTMPHPWLKYSIASYYNTVDEIVVGNAGWDFPEWTDDNTPMPSVTAELKELDVNGKIHELKGEQMSWRQLEKLHAETDEKETPAETGLRARNATIANDYAGRVLGADWVLWIASDQVFYKSAKELRALTQNTRGTDGFQFYEHKAYWGSQWFMCKDATDPYSDNDGAKFYKYPGNAGQRQWFKGEGGIMNYRDQTPDESILTAHMRECYPASEGTVDAVGLLWSQTIRHYFYELDHGKCERTGLSKQDAFRRAVNGAWSVVQRARYENLRLADPKPPEVFYAKSPEQWILDGEPK